MKSSGGTAGPSHGRSGTWYNCDRAQSKGRAVMIKTRSNSGRNAATVRDDAVGIFLTPNGRLPGFAQRRLDDLLAKKSSEGLTTKEQRELSEALDYIDTKTIEMLEHGLLADARAGAVRPG